MLFIHTSDRSALRRKNALHDSHEIASKLYPKAGPSQTTHFNSSVFFRVVL